MTKCIYCGDTAEKNKKVCKACRIGNQYRHLKNVRQ